MSREDKEQQARIALLDYYGSLARHWATVLLATVVAFYSVVQFWNTIHNDWLIIFALGITASGGTYAFLRVVTHGMYCELALDPEVWLRGHGTCLSQMLHGMLHHFRTKERKIMLGKHEKRVKLGRYLDRLGVFPGWLYWGFGWAIGTVLALIGASTCDLLPSPDLLSQLRPCSCPKTVVVVLALIGVIVLVLFLLFRRIDPEDYENETPISPYGSKIVESG